MLTIYERDGRLFADGLQIHEQPLPQSGLGFMRADGRTVAVMLGRERLPRRDFGAEVVAAIQAKVKADPAAARAAALAATSARRARAEAARRPGGPDHR